MTREEIIERLQSIKALVDKYDDVVALREAIKAVEQEPCEDANANQHNSNALNDVGQHKNALEEDTISRQAAIDALKNLEDLQGRNVFTKNGLYPWNVIAQLPSVTPKQRTGHNCNEDYADCDQFVCSECGIELQDWCRIERDEDDGKITCHEYVMKYCPNCGTRMVEPQESEDNEDIPMEYFESGGC